ncbi:MAG TPA: PAS domain S-box protein, partial [Opitutales bacterium]|nr:PAS domain S-box protein [Opitutales bacterium]
MIFETIETALEAHPVLSAAIHLGAVTVCLTFFLYLTGTRKKQVESTKDDKTFAYDIEGKSHFRPAKESANRNPSPAAEPGKSLQSKPPAPPPPGIHLPRSAPIRLEVIPEPAAENPSSNAEAAATTDAQDVTQAKDQSPGDLPSSAKPDEKEFTIRFPEGMPPVDTKDTDPVAHHTKEEIAIRIYQIFQGKDAETLIAIDREEHILALNPGAEKLFQYPSHELRGKKIEDIIFLEPGDKTGTTASGSDPFDDDDDTQRAKGHAKDGSSFPVGVELEMADRPLGIILVKIHTMDLLLQPGKPVFEDLPAVEPEAARDSTSTIGSIAATAAALQPILSQTDSESAEPEAVNLEPIEPTA